MSRRTRAQLLTDAIKTSSQRETYKFASTHGDRAFLNWIADRLVNKYGESENVDFVRTLRTFANGINEIVNAASKKP